MIQVKKTHENATFNKAFPSDAGFDLTCCGIEMKNNAFWFDLGIQVAPPSGYYFRVVPRSSFSKTGFVLANSVGIIDETYRGNWYFVVRNIIPVEINKNGEYPATILEAVQEMFLYKRVAQATLHKNYNNFGIVFVDKLDVTDRNTGGFGSTGE